MIGIFFLVLLVAGALSVVYWTLKNGISPMPTSRKVMKALEMMLPGEVHGTIYELGCGWGTTFGVLSRRYPKSKIIALESSWVPFCVAWLLSRQYPNISVQMEDIFSKDISDAGLVFCYLYPGAMERLKDKFQRELPTGCWVVTHTFAIAGWKAYWEHQVQDLYRTKIYLYRL